MKEYAFSKGGSEYISERIREAVENMTRTVVISGAWEIDEAVRIPSNFSLILEDCHLRMADGCYSNMFVNENHDTDLGRTIDGTDRNISIIGRGNAILDGGSYNGLSESTARQPGMPPIWKNNVILFTNVDGFKVTGIHIRNQRWWALNFIFCANGYIGNIDFCACDVAIDKNGNKYHGLKREAYDEIYVRNADGVDLRQGCHDIVIENITGFTEDDTVALTALEGRMEKYFAVEGLPTDLCRVEIKNIRSAAFCSNVRLLNQGETKLHDILIDGVYDLAPESPHMDKGGMAVRVGDIDFLYGTRHSTKEETYNITIKNVVGSGVYVVTLAGEIGNVVMYGIESRDGAILLRDNRTNK